MPMTSSRCAAGVNPAEVATAVSAPSMRRSRLEGSDTSVTAPQLEQTRWWWCSERSSASSNLAKSSPITMRRTTRACSRTARLRYRELWASPRRFDMISGSDSGRLVAATISTRARRFDVYRWPARRSRPATSTCKSVVICGSVSAGMRITENGPVVPPSRADWWNAPQPDATKQATPGSASANHGDDRERGRRHQYDRSPGCQVPQARCHQTDDDGTHPNGHGPAHGPPEGPRQQLGARHRQHHQAGDQQDADHPHGRHHRDGRRHSKQVVEQAYRKASHPGPLLVSDDGEQGPPEAQDRGRDDHAESEDREHFAIGDRQD